MAQRLNRRSVQDADEKRATKFFADARLPSAERAELEDYKRSGYSRGHMAPAGDMPTPTAMAQSFSLANMVPQDIQHNGGAWAKIEQDTRHYVRRAKGDVFVITGPVFTPSGGTEYRAGYLPRLIEDIEKKPRAERLRDGDEDGLTKQVESVFTNVLRRLPSELKKGVSDLSKPPSPGQDYKFAFEEEVRDFANPADLYDLAIARTMVDDSQALAGWRLARSSHCSSTPSKKRRCPTTCTSRGRLSLRTGATSTNLKSSVSRGTPRR